MFRRHATSALATLQRIRTTAGPRGKTVLGMLSLAWAAAFWAPAADGQTPDRQLAGQGFWGVPAASLKAPSPTRVSQAAHEVWTSPQLSSHDQLPPRDQLPPHDCPEPQGWANEGGVYPGTLTQELPPWGAAAGLTWQPPYPEGYAGPAGPLAGAEPYGVFGSWPSGSRHWVRHFGYRRAYTQWTLK